MIKIMVSSLWHGFCDMIKIKFKFKLGIDDQWRRKLCDLWMTTLFFIVNVLAWAGCVAMVMELLRGMYYAFGMNMIPVPPHRPDVLVAFGTVLSIAVGTIIWVCWVMESVAMWKRHTMHYVNDAWENLQ